MITVWHTLLSKLEGSVFDQSFHIYIYIDSTSPRCNLVSLIHAGVADTLSKRDASYSVNKISFPFLILLEIRREKSWTVSKYIATGVCVRLMKLAALLRFNMAADFVSTEPNLASSLIFFYFIAIQTFKLLLIRIII